MNRDITAILLAGRIRPSLLREELDIHVLRLPIGRSGTLLDAWMNVLAEVPGLTRVRVVVNTPDDVESVSNSMDSSMATSDTPQLEIIPEPAAWRGAGGVLKDIAGDLPHDTTVLVCEAKRLPPESLDPIINAMTNDDRAPTGVVGVCGRDQPAGVYFLPHSALNLIPDIGYFDLKEQFLPALYRTGQRIITAPLGPDVWSLRDRPSYLKAVRHTLSPEASQTSGLKPHNSLRVSPSAKVSSTAILDGFVIIDDGAVIEDGAVVHDSVVLAGATIGGGAVITRSVVGVAANVEPRTRVVGHSVITPMIQTGTRHEA